MATATETALESPPTVLATDVPFVMALTKGGRVSVASSARRIIPGDDVPALLKAAAEAVVIAEFDLEAAETAFTQAELDGLPREVVAHRKHLRSEAVERQMMAETAFESRLCKFDRWAVVVVLDRGVWLTEPSRSRPEVVAEPLSGKHSCVMCRGLGRVKAGYGDRVPVGTVTACTACNGSAVRSHAIPTWIVEGLAKHVEARKDAAIAAEVERLDAEF